MRDWGLGALFGVPNWLRNMVSWTLPAHQKGVKGQTLAGQGRQGGTETRWVRV
jgi:hypothetical protein